MPWLPGPGQSDSVGLESPTPFLSFHAGVISPPFFLCCNPVWGNVFPCYSLLIFRLCKVISQDFGSLFYFSSPIVILCIDFFPLVKSRRVHLCHSKVI